MQVSDLNKSLLSMLVGNREDKVSGDKVVAEKFSELLRSAGGNGETVKNNPKAVTGDYHRQVSLTEAGERSDADNRTSMPDDNDGTSEEKVSSPVKKERNKKTREEHRDEPVVSESKMSPARSQEKTSDSPIDGNASGVVENTDVTGAVGKISSQDVISGIMPEVAFSSDGGEFSFVMENTGTAVVIDNEVSAEDMSVAANAGETDSVIPVAGTPLRAETSGEENTGLIATDDKGVGAEQRKTFSPATDEIEMPAEIGEQTAETEIVRQEEKIAGMLPKEKSVEIKVSARDDKVTGFEDKRIVAPLVENADLNTDAEEAVSFVNTETGNIPTVDAGADLSKPAVLPAADIAPVEVSASVVSAGEKGEIYAVQALSSGEAARPSLTSGVRISSGHNPADVRSDGLTREVAEQIKVNITRSALKGVDKVEIQLKPADLGRLEIKMQIARDGTLHAHIVASSAETLDILQKDLSALKEAFNNAGYQTEDGSFSFGYRDGEQNNNEREQLRSFIGEVITREVAEELAANDYVGADGVNIRV